MALFSTRLHGIADYAVAAAFAALARSRRLPLAVRRVLGSAAAYHAGYSALTDYDAGLWPVIGMRTHLALDTVGALALCAAGVGVRRHPTGSRALLVAAGLSELAVIALTDREHLAGQGRADLVTYPPLDTPKPVAEGVWVVDSVFPGLPGQVFGVRMTVLRLGSDDLVLHSPTRVTVGLQAALERLGRVRHLVAPNLAHLSFIADWKRAYPNATLWAAPGVESRGKVRRGTICIDRELRSTPVEWRDEIEVVLVPGSAGFTEAALFHRPTGTLVLTDLVINLEPAKVPGLVRPLVRLFGSLAPNGMPPPYLRFVLRAGRRPFVQAARRLVDLKPDRVIFAHGRWFEHDATAALRRSLRWVLD